MLLINLYNPDFYFDLCELRESKQVYTELRKHGVAQKYTYAIFYKLNYIQFTCIKIGQSCPEPGPNTQKAVGERLGRQLGYLDGWGVIKPYSIHGADLYMNIMKEIRLGKLPKDAAEKSNIRVGVWNLDKVIPTSFIRRPKDTSEWAEGELAKQFKLDNNGMLPVLNYKDPTKNSAYTKCNVNIDHFNMLFTTGP